MKTTFQSLSALNHTSDNFHKIIQIESWINSNSNALERNVIWRVGLCDAEHLLEIEGKVRSNMEFKHFKSWRIDDIAECVLSIARLTRSKKIFKSPYHCYQKKGNYLFAYKCPCPFKSNFYHALHY